MKLFDPEEKSPEIPDSFDLNYWVSYFPLEEYRLSGRGVAGGPLCVAINEQIRRKAGGALALGPSVPTDIFILGKGDPLERDVTKIGGVPYRPARLKWPKTAAGPMTFLAQYQFRDSKDIVGDLPGDLLLIFTTRAHLYGKHPSFHFEWYSLDEDDLILRSNLPRPAFEFITGFGVRHRTVDYVDDKQALAAIERVVALENLRASDECLANRQAFHNNGLKIGGIPFWLNEDNVDRSSLTGQFLCSLTDIWPYVEKPYPWINVATPIPLESSNPGDQLYWFDGFTINFFLEKNGKIHYHSQFL